MIKKNFPFLATVIRMTVYMFLRLCNFILTLLYLSLPMWAFLALMQLRDKNNKGNAIGTFVNEKSEFQFIYPDYILVSNKPNNFKTNVKARINEINTFIEKYKWLLIIGCLSGILICVVLISIC